MIYSSRIKRKLNTIPEDNILLTGYDCDFNHEEGITNECIGNNTFNELECEQIDILDLLKNIESDHLEKHHRSFELYKRLFMQKKENLENHRHLYLCHFNGYLRFLHILSDRMDRPDINDINFKVTLDMISFALEASKISLNMLKDVHVTFSQSTKLYDQFRALFPDAIISCIQSELLTSKYKEINDLYQLLVERYEIIFGAYEELFEIHKIIAISMIKENIEIDVYEMKDLMKQNDEKAKKKNIR